jgi:hypothetical protein
VLIPAVHTPHPPLVWQVPPVPHWVLVVHVVPGVGPLTHVGTQLSPAFGPPSHSESGKHSPGAPPQFGTGPDAVTTHASPAFVPSTQCAVGAVVEVPSFCPQKPYVVAVAIEPFGSTSIVHGVT